MKRRLIMAALLLGPACRDSTAPDVVTHVWFKTATTGGDIDNDGYRMTVDDTIKFALAPSTIYRLDGLEPRLHQLAISDVSENCVLKGDPLRQFTASEDEVLDVVIEVECQATGVEVTTETRGLDVPLEGFVATVAGRKQRLAPAGVATVTRIAPGAHMVMVEPPDNCEVAGEAQRIVTIENRKVIPVSFEIECVLTPKEVAFTNHANVPAQFFSALATSTGTGTHLFNLIKDAHSPAWSPNGGKLAYSDVLCDWYYGYCQGGLHVIDADTRTADPMFEVPNATDPAWSPDGKALAYVEKGNQLKSTLVVHRLGGITRVIFDRPLNDVSSPTWSPDGERMAFACSLLPALQHICVMNVGSSEFTQITTGNDWFGTPAWSPDGRTIAFARQVPQMPTEIYVMNPDGSNVRRVTVGRDPAWLPDSSRLVFSGATGLATINPDGSQLTQITTGSHSQPAWRP